MKQTLVQIQQTISGEKQRYKREGFDIVGVFGSYAKKTEDRYSDLDIAYHLDFAIFDERYKGGFAKLLRIEAIQKELQKLLGVKVDLVSMNSANERFKEHIKKELVYV